MIKEIKIANKKAGDSHPCFIIAEAGSNHNGRLSLAKKLVDVAVLAGADAVKFQHFSAEWLYPQKSKTVRYLKEMGIKKPIYEVIKDIEISDPEQWTRQLSSYCKKKGIIFFSFPLSEQDADILSPYVPVFKIGSYEITHLPLIKHIAKKGKPLIISTGTATIREIRQAVRAAQSVGNNKVCLMQCTAKYPAPLDSLNTRVISALKKEFKVPVGLSDHSLHPLYGAAAALACGANLYEKHFTLSRKMKGPDHSFALEPEELAECVSLIRNIEKALGSENKTLQKVEKELFNFRRAVYVIKPIKAGERLTKINTRILRKPGIAQKGIPPADYEKVLGKTAKKNVKPFTLLSWALLR